MSKKKIIESESSNQKTYEHLAVFPETKKRFLRLMRGDETQEIFLNKLLDIYEKKKPVC